jgi:polyphosphate kinase
MSEEQTVSVIKVDTTKVPEEKVLQHMADVKKVSDKIGEFIEKIISEKTLMNLIKIGNELLVYIHQNHEICADIEMIFNNKCDNTRACTMEIIEGDVTYFLHHPFNVFLSVAKLLSDNGAIVIPPSTTTTPTTQENPTNS